MEVREIEGWWRWLKRKLRRMKGKIVEFRKEIV
jgi:hypothetical protein